MTTSGPAMLDAPTAEALGEQFHRCFETLEAPDGLFSDDAFFDILPPLWRFQLAGPDAFISQLRSIAEGRSEVEVIRTIPTATGFVTEHVETQHADKVETARRVWLCTVVDGRITEATGYCNGGWDDELRARHAVEAPMIRP